MIEKDIQNLTESIKENSKILTQFISNQIKFDAQNLFQQLNSPEVDKVARHYYSWNYRMTELIKERSRRAARDTYDFIDRELRNALYELDQFKVIHSTREDIINCKGHILDLGVYKGASTRALAKSFPEILIHGFDSFEGLPENWSHVMSGAFGEIKGKLPDMPENVKLYKGWFNDTLKVWVESEKPEQISLLRVDCDIYSSTRTIFEELGRFIRKGSYICFDELIGYYGWQEHEYKAFQEFVEANKIKFRYIAYGLTYVLLKIV